MKEFEIHACIDRIAAGDQSAFKQLYEHTKDDVYRTVSFLAVDRQDIHEIVNEVYIRFWKSLANYDRSRPFRFWLHGLIVRVSQDWKRRVWRRLRITDRKKALEVEEHDWSDRSVLEGETREELAALVRSLPYKFRVVLILRYYNQHTFDEIAALLDIPAGTVKSRHHSAIKRMREKWETSARGKVNSFVN